MDKRSYWNEIPRKIHCTLSGNQFSVIIPDRYQDIKSGDCLLFWVQLNEFYKLPLEYKTAKASLLFQKFIKLNAYRYISWITDEQRIKVENQLNESMEENGPPLPKDIFDEIMEETESLLIENVMKGFYTSFFYREYKEAVVLSSNL